MACRYRAMVRAVARAARPHRGSRVCRFGPSHKQNPGLNDSRSATPRSRRWRRPVLPRSWVLKFAATRWPARRAATVPFSHYAVPAKSLELTTSSVQEPAGRIGRSELHSLRNRTRSPVEGAGVNGWRLEVRRVDKDSRTRRVLLRRRTPHATSELGTIEDIRRVSR